MTTDQQKKAERHFVETAANILKLTWEIVDQGEKPDFIIDENGTRFGLEVTEIFKDPITPKGSAIQKQQETHRHSQLQNLEQRYTAETGIKLYLRFLRSPQNDTLRNISDTEIDEIEAALHAENLPEQEWGFSKMLDLPGGGKIQITVYRYSEWIVINDQVGFVLQSPSEKIQQAIDGKFKKLENYKNRAGEDIRLLVVANRRNNSGKICISEAYPVEINPKGFSAVYFLSYPSEASRL